MTVLLLMMILLSVACTGKSRGNENKVVGSDTDALAVKPTPDIDTIGLFVRRDTLNGIPFISLRMNRNVAYVAMVDSVIPDLCDTTIFLCVEAAYTGKCLQEFKSTNVAGDYVINGRRRKGYECSVNTGYLCADCDGNVRIHSIDSNMTVCMQEAYTLFQQELLIEGGEYAYDSIGGGHLLDAVNIYRAACMKDGDFLIVQSEAALKLRMFIHSLLQMGISEALYLDMGRGWNYGWYRQTASHPATKFFDYKSPYQTNWLLIRLQGSGQ